MANRKAFAADIACGGNHACRNQSLQLSHERLLLLHVCGPMWVHVSGALFCFNCFRRAGSGGQQSAFG